MSLTIRIPLAALVMAAIPSLAAAQFPPPQSQSGSSPTVQERWPDPVKPPTDQPQPPPAAKRPPPQAKRPPPQAKTAPENPDAPAAPKAAAKAPAKPAPAVAANVVACNGVFAKDSTHLKLAIKYDLRNVVYGEVDGPDGSKLNASILFPNDPRRRLEVLWNNDAARSDTSVISINGKSQWGAPKGLKLGLALAALEKANGRPFKLSGFGKDGAASVTGWENGALSTLPGGCKVGVRLMADSKSPEGARGAVAGDTELLSNDARLRAVKPTVGEILIGY